MNWRKVTVALLSGLILTGAWYYRDSLTALTQPSPRREPVALASSSTSTSTSAAATNSNAAPAASPEGKRILAVDNAGIYTGTQPASVPISKESASGRKVVEMLSPEEATKKLRRNEESYLVNRGRGVFRYDVVQIPSNDPIEDDHAEKIIEIPEAAVTEEGVPGSTDWMFWGVFDGHSGWTTSAKLRQVLIAFVARELHATYKAAIADPSQKAPAQDVIDQAIKNGFMKLDNEIVNESVEKVFKSSSKLVAAETLAPALSGSCALLAFYESRSQMLKVAVTGDSRAVLGRMGQNGKWTATPLSDDQTGSTKSEEKRIRAEHPGEDGVIRNGRVLGGLEPTRAFGDAFYKWSYETQTKLKSQFFGRNPHPHLKTPPYVTAEPVITTTKIEPQNGDFLVMATDGLWEMLTNEEVVGLVGKWIEEQKAAAAAQAAAQAAGASSNSVPANGKKSAGWFGGWFGGKKEPEVLPVEESQAEDTSGQRAPVRIRQWGVKKEDERFVCEDKNAATHVVRNALGGKNSEMLCALLTLPSPYSRRYRDDLTVEVIFFGEGDKSGNVEVNEEATAISKQSPPPKDQKKEKDNNNGEVVKAKL
ncbi:phosphatase 2C-like domain-containing protein [Tricharina praecox]|uniref:phosphatase 2C-like domain-containing protein n=1 Tax=Tricharina praecox TaxID=43433 RepID=UPI002220A2CD|nr:phosphatase 2C-like domain-containing protein [Tricharina praecox]KAI5857170.1 phosphatase 2C-like domain-containing protein [Tricharina praecox]